jgi:4-hydroxy-tetrahydrodipicolinate synthase
LICIDNLVGLKDSSWNMEEFVRMIALKSIRADFNVLQGIETLALQSLHAGADGVLPGLSNVIPAFFRQLIDFFRCGNLAEAEKIQSRISGVYQLYKSGFWIECLKYALSLLGYGQVVLCSRPNVLTEEEKQGIYEILSSYSDFGSG